MAAEAETPRPAPLLRFNASKSQVDNPGIFLKSGGQLNALAVPFEVDLALTGCKTATVHKLDLNNTDVEIAFPEGSYEFVTEETDAGVREVLLVPSSLRLSLCSTAVAAGINGTLSTTVSGQKSVFLWSVLKETGHTQVGLEYASWKAHACTIGISETRVVAGSGKGEKLLNVRYAPPTEAEALALGNATVQLQKYFDDGWARREKILYEASPTLTKTVFSDTVGLSGSGFSPVHDIVERVSPLSHETVDSLFKVVLLNELGNDEARLESFLAATAVPGGAAAEKAKTVASAISIAVNYLVAYRADGRATVQARGTEFKAAESWLRQAARSPIEANDCDGSALTAVGLLRKAIQAPAEFKHLRAVRNVLLPHYQVGIVVLGASAAEATSADASHSSVAGHAIAMLLPVLPMLRAIELGDTGDGAAERAEARFQAFFDDDVKSQLSAYDVEKLGSWAVARLEFKGRFPPLAIEGTTPASSVVREPNSEKRESMKRNAAADDAALSKIDPNVFRAVKSLHVGGKGAGEHRFYRDFVEISFARSCPLYTNARVRALGGAAAQFVFLSGGQCGVSPEQLVNEDFTMKALVDLTADQADALDFASAIAEKNTLPPRRGPLALDAYMSTQLRTSEALLEELGTHLSSGTGDGDGGVQFIGTLSTFIFNSDAVGQFCKAVKKVAKGGFVDKAVVDGLAVDADGEPAGLFFSIECFV